MDKHDAQIMGFLNEVHGEMYCQSCLGAVDKEPRETCMQPDWHEALASGAKGNLGSPAHSGGDSANVPDSDVVLAYCDELLGRVHPNEPVSTKPRNLKVLSAEVRRLREEVRDKDVAYIEAIDSQEAELKQLREENFGLRVGRGADAKQVEQLREENAGNRVEIERLTAEKARVAEIAREENADLRAQAEAADTHSVNVKAEYEEHRQRLEKSVAAQTKKAADDYQARWDELREENARLAREEAAWREINRQAANTVATLEAENARLKRMLTLEEEISRGRYEDLQAFTSRPRYSTEAVDALLNEVEYRCTEDSGPWCAAQAVRASREPRS